MYNRCFLIEFTGDVQRQNWNVLGLQHVQTGSVVTIVSGATSNRYRVQSNDGLSMALVVQQLLNRLKDKATGNFTTTVAHNHVQLVQSQMEAHFCSRQEADRIAVIERLFAAYLVFNGQSERKEIAKELVSRRADTFVVIA